MGPDGLGIDRTLENWRRWTGEIQERIDGALVMDGLK
jgi:hypothetical protein